MKSQLAALVVGSGLLLGEAANGAGFNLAVDAVKNCFDIQSRSIQALASHDIENGRYVVSLNSSDAYYCGFLCPVPKVTIYVTTHGIQKGWFNQVEAWRPIVIDVNGEGAAANTVFAFYTDFICGDNIGGSILSFRKVTSGKDEPG